MTIAGFDEDAIGRVIGEIFTPARAVSSLEFLKGREVNLKEIGRAFAINGRHVFIYGDRGVGKTSLALTSAHVHQSPDGNPLNVSCDSDATLFSLVEDIGNQALAASPGKIEKNSHSVGFNFKFLSASKQKEITNGSMPKLETLNECVDVIRLLPTFHSSQPVIIFDEFDRVKDAKVKRQFAEFLKKISDSDVLTKIIFCGIATSLDELIDEHLSVARNLASIELKRLSHDGRWAIINEACSKLNIELPNDMVVRIGQISDGFPHYVHLIGEKIFWSMSDDSAPVRVGQKRHFEAGVAVAVREAEALPRLAYSQATEKYTDDYKEVLWAVADGPHLRRQTTEMYAKSYLPIMEKRVGRQLLNKATFSNRLNRLKLESHGNILSATGGGWYQYSDNIVRGYVRLKAQEDGVEIGDGYFNANDR